MSSAAFWNARAWFGSIATNLSFPRPLRTLNLRVDEQLTYLETTRQETFVLDPNYPPPYFPPTGFDTRTVFTLTHASAQRQPFDISRSYGHVATLSAAIREPYLGSRTRAQGLSWRLEQYVRLGLRESVLALAYNTDSCWCA